MWANIFWITKRKSSLHVQGSNFSLTGPPRFTKVLFELQLAAATCCQVEEHTAITTFQRYRRNFYSVVCGTHTDTNKTFRKSACQCFFQGAWVIRIENFVLFCKYMICSCGNLKSTNVFFESQLVIGIPGKESTVEQEWHLKIEGQISTFYELNVPHLYIE